MKIGVLCNVRAGRAEGLPGILRKMAPALRGHAVTCVKGYGEGFLPGEAVLPQPPAAGFLPALEAATGALLEAGPELMIVVGGDGVAAYAAEVMIRTGHADLPLLGIAMGTANVGPIITVDLSREDMPALETLLVTSSGAVEALENGRHIAWGFNDLVLGNTLLATVNGRMITVSAREMALRGERLPCPPMRSVSASPRITKNGLDAPFETKEPAQVIVSCLERDRYYGRAIAGALCCSAFSPAKAAMALTRLPLISMDTGGAGFDAFMGVEHLLFTPEDRVEITGLSPEVCLIADGNPYLLGGGTVTFRYAPRVLTIAKRGERADEHSSW